MKSDNELKLFKKFVNDFFYIDLDGNVRENFNECYEIHNRMPVFCEMIKKYISDNWQKENEVNNEIS